MLLDVVVGIHCLLETLVNLLERVEAVGVLLEALEREREDLRSMVEVERRVMLQLVGALVYEVNAYVLLARSLLDPLLVDHLAAYLHQFFNL